MSAEITIFASLSCTNGSLKIAVSPGQVQIDQATARGGNPGTVTVGTSEEVISFGDLVAPRWAFLRNLSPTNYVDFGPESAGAMVAALRLKAGEYAILPLVPAAVYRAKANTAAVDLQITALET